MVGDTERDADAKNMAINNCDAFDAFLKDAKGLKLGFGFRVLGGFSLNTKCDILSFVGVGMSICVYMLV